MSAAAGPSLVSARLALRWLIGGEWRAHPARFLGTALAIAVGVALGFAVHLVNGSALASFEGAVRGVNGAADRTVRAASRLGLDESLYPQVLRATGVADASPVVSLDAVSGEARFTLLGLDVIRAAAVTPSLVGLRPNGVDTGSDDIFDPDAIFLSRAALAGIGKTVGERIEVSANGRTATLRIAGTLPGLAEDQRVGTMDIAGAQWRFDRLGRLDRIDLKLGEARAAEDALRALLPAGASLTSTETQAAQGSNLSRAYRVNLDMLALVALVTGGFLVFSAQSLSVARRMRAFALLRTLGLPRRGIVAAVAAEGVLIGTIGSVAGLLGGAVLAVLALRWFGGDLGAGYFAGGAVSIAFPPGAAVAFFALGLAAAVLGSVLPAQAASRALPAAALKNAGDILDPRRPVPWKPAVLLVGLGLAASLVPAVNGLPILGFVGMALILAGGVAGVPWLARALLGLVARRRTGRVPADLALAHVRGAPGGAAAALCGIVASTALMIAMATMVTSFRGAVDEWLGQVLSADLYLRGEGGVSFDPATQDSLRAVPGVQRLYFSRQLGLSIEPDRPPVTLIARSLDGGPSDSLLVGLEKAEGVPADAVPVWVSEPAARLYGWTPGETIRLPVGPAEQRFAVAGVWRDYARQFGAVAMRSADYERLTGDRSRDEALAVLEPGLDAESVGRLMLAAVPADARPSVSLARPQTLRAYALDLFDRSFAVTYVLEAVAILVGLAGVVATFSAQTVARAREFGMLRHLGLAKRQIAAMLGVEGALLGFVGGIAGVALGLVLSQILIHVINPQSFNWTMETRLPVGTIGGVVAALVVAAAVTAVAAGRRATAKSAVLAVREDW